MRMRKKKHTANRILACSDLLIANPSEMKGFWHSLCGKRALCLEIGCGKGDFITQLARQSPDGFFVALEKVPDVIVMAMEKAKRGEISNLRFICGDAQSLCDIFAQDEVSRIFLNFSDPWPKKKHAKRRLTANPFLCRYKSITKEGGEIFLKTDNRALFDFSLEEFSRAGIPVGDVTYDLHSSEYAGDNLLTEYEKAFSEKGFPIHRAVARIVKDPPHGKRTEGSEGGDIELCQP